MENNDMIIAKAKESKNAEELLSMAKENGFELTEDEAKAYYARLHPTSGELSDEELDSVAGGGCSVNVKGQSRTVVSSGCPCFAGGYVCGAMQHIANGTYLPIRKDNYDLRKLWLAMAWIRSSDKVCGACYYLEFENGIGYCGFNAEG